MNEVIHRVQGGAMNFCLGGPSAMLIYLSRQLLRTYIYTYVRFFIIYTHFLFDKCKGQKRAKRPKAVMDPSPRSPNNEFVESRNKS